MAASVLLGARLFAAADDTVRVTVARVDLPAGAPVGPGDLDTRDVRFGDQELADLYLPAGAALPAGAVLIRDVVAGEMVPRAAIGRQATTLTEVPLSVAADAVPRDVHAGSVVDVWVTPRPEAGAQAGDQGGGLGGGQGASMAESVLVFDDVVVVDAPRTGSALGPSATRQVVVGVPDEQQDRLATALARLATGTVLLTERG
ncbi:MAG TPA: SAF domain-containing protein [Nocardioidaceae bacterium]|nr:SAF domain-containing protein [Nocardioidaceae bacterium]